MGYTHYWRTYRDFTEVEWVALQREAERIVQAAQDRLDINLAGPMEEGLPEITEDAIALNGASDEGYESFVLTRKQRDRRTWETEPARLGLFDFCKTGRRPYDSVVVSILYAANKIAGDAISVSSDGGDIFAPLVDELLAQSAKPEEKSFSEVNIEILENKLSGVLDSICQVVNIDFAAHGVSTKLHEQLVSKFSEVGEKVETLTLLGSQYDAFCSIAESLGAKIKKEYNIFKHLNELTLIETYASN